MGKKTSNYISEPRETRPKTGRGGTDNFPSRRYVPENDEDRALVSTLLTEVLTEYRKTRVTSDEELEQRLDDYFVNCACKGQTPTVEEMCMCTGYSQNTCDDWISGRNKGFSVDTSSIMKKAKDFLKAFDAKLVVSGKLNFLAYCFRAKNYYDMVDKKEHIVTPNVQNAFDYSAEDIKRRYMIEEDGDE